VLNDALLVDVSLRERNGFGIVENSINHIVFILFALTKIK